MQGLKSKVFRTLRSSEKVLKLDMVYLTKGGFWTTLSFAIGVVGSLATMVAFGNLLPKEIYGTYSYLISLAGSLTFLTLTGVAPAVTRAVARGYENIVPYAQRMQLKYNLLATITIGGVALYYTLKGNYVFGISLALLAIAYPLGEAFHLYKQVLTGRKRFDSLTKIASITTFVGTIATVTTLLLTDNVVLIITTFSLLLLGPSVLAYRWVTKDIDRSVPEEKLIVEMRRTALHITGAGIIGTIASYIDKIMLFQIAGPATLAVYGFAIAGPERLKALLKNWMSIALPRLAESSLREIRLVFYKRVGLSMLVGLFLAVVYIIFSPHLFGWLLPKYLESIKYSQVYALGLIIVPASIYIASVFATQNMLRAVYVQSVGNQIIRITLYVTFGLLWQIWGLVIASLLSNVINAIYSIIVWEIEFKRLEKINAK